MSTTTQAERIAMMDRMRAAGMLPRYRVRLPAATTTFARMRAMRAWEHKLVRSTRHGRSAGSRYVFAVGLLDAMGETKLHRRGVVRRVGGISRLRMRQHQAVHRALGIEGP